MASAGQKDKQKTEVYPGSHTLTPPAGLTGLQWGIDPTTANLQGGQRPVMGEAKFERKSQVNHIS